MSGFAGIVNLDAAPISDDLLRAMSSALAFRGPDRVSHWCGGEAGLAHAWLKTTDDAPVDHQPFTVDGDAFIVGDARIDGRRELISALPVSPTADLATVADIELVLRAYLRWGTHCVDRLLGDFAFAVWDASRRRLFAARDHMGVRPFYYAQVRSSIVFSNTLACVRLHPSISNRLNDLAVADFLVFDANQNPSETVFADVHRLPAAHTLAATRGCVTTTRYWSLPIEEPLFCPRLSDYTEQFQSLLRTAVDDRIRGAAVGVFMSGGLDSPTLAATAHRAVPARRRQPVVRAFTWVEDRHDGGRERRYAGLAAAYIGIPVEFYEPDLEPIDWTWEQHAPWSPEPDSSAWQTIARRVYHRRVAASVRVCFHGEGPDNSLYYEWRAYLRYLVSTRRFGDVAEGLMRHLVTQRRFPLWNRWFAAPGRRPRDGALPACGQALLTSDLARRAAVDGRQDAWRATIAAHPVRPRAYASLSSPLWQTLFDAYDAEWTQAPLEVRHPFLDIRLLRFMLRVPAVPWCRRKYLLRRSMRGQLPAALLAREKASIPAENIQGMKRRLVSQPLVATPALLAYVDTRRLEDADLTNAQMVDTLIRVRSLNHWLRHLETSRH